jgi:hypothetical protein
MVGFPSIPAEVQWMRPGEDGIGGSKRQLTNSRYLFTLQSGADRDVFGALQSPWPGVTVALLFLEHRSQLIQGGFMSSRAIAAAPAETWTNRIDAVSRLLGWVRPSTSGRRQALARLEQLKAAVSDGDRFSRTLSLLARDLDELYPSSAIVSLARRRVRDMVLAITYHR